MGFSACAFQLSLHAEQTFEEAKDHRLVLFYTQNTATEALTGARDPWVHGGELILFWSEVEPQDNQFDWSRIDRDLEFWGSIGEKLDVRLSTAHVWPNNTPNWLFEEPNQVRRVGQGFFEDFEIPAKNASSLAQVKGDYSWENATVADGSLILSSKNTDTPATFRLSRDLQSRSEFATHAIQWNYTATANAILTFTAFNGTVGSNYITQNATAPAESTLHSAQPYKASAVVELKPAERISLKWEPISGDIALHDVNIIRIDGYPTFIEEDFSAFETESSLWVAGPTANYFINDGASGFSLEGQANESLLLIQNHPLNFDPRQYEGFNFRFTVESTNSCTVNFRIISESNPQTPILNRDWQLQGDNERVTLQEHFVQPLMVDDARIELRISGDTTVKLHEASFRRHTDRVAVFPDYFDTRMQEEWAELVTAFAERYKNHPSLGIISVGGFGRWEEVMLDNDIYGALDVQWMERGFTEDSYIQLIRNWMQMYRGAFGEHPLRIC